MKNLKIYFIGIAVLITFSRCGEEFLFLENPNTITNESFWKTEADFQKGLIATYSALQYQNVSGGTMSSRENIRSDIGRSFDFYNTQYAFHQLNWNASSPYPSARWSELYIGVFRANQVIEKLAAADGIDPASKSLILGQARFLRAVFYFWLANSYNGAVIHTEVPVKAEEFKRKFEDRGTVIETIVKPDLRFAMSVLPKKWEGNENIGRITWGAATSLLGKVHLYDVRPEGLTGSVPYDSAAFYFKQVIDSDLYKLTDNIGDNFTAQNEFNSESIFEVSFNDKVNEGVSGASKDDIGNSQGAEATTKPRGAAPQLRGGFRTVVPTHWVNELYENDEIDPANPINIGNNYSMRAYWSIAFLRQDDGPLGTYYQQDNANIRNIADWFNGGAESCYWKKGTSWYESKNENALDRSGINERIIRLADVYLMYAEALLGSQGDGALEEALQYVDNVRRRSGVLTLDQYRNTSSGRIPQLHKRGMGAAKHPMILLNAQSLLTHIQYVERVLELAYEGNAIRWNDLVRWGIVREAFENQDDHSFVDLVVNPESGQQEPIDNGIIEFCGPTCAEPEPFFLGRAILRYASAEVQLERYAPERHDYFDIPNNEVNNNNNL